MKKVLTVLLLASFLVACGPVPQSPAESKEQAPVEKTSSESSNPLGKLCDYFPKELVETAIGKAIVKVEESSIGWESCNYYTAYSETYEHTPYGDHAGGPKVIVLYDTEDFARDRITNEKSGTTYESDPSIGMANFVMKNNIHKIWQTALVLGDEKYIRIKFIDDAVTGEDLVKIARELAKKLSGDTSFNLESATTTEESTETTETEASNTAETLSANQQALATTFFSALGSAKIQDALTLMDADPDTKQAWGVNFNTIESLQVKKIEEAFRDEWTPTRQSYKAELEVKVKPEGLEMGWQNGTNYRWITLEQDGNGTWLVHELANNP